MVNIQSLVNQERMTEEVTTFDESLQQLAKILIDTLHRTDGVGLSAPQIGRNERIAVIDFQDDRDPLVLVNPTLLKYYGKSVEMEGCLSYPGIYGEVERPEAIRIEAEDEYGKTFEITAEGFEARAILHEMDHLYGISFTQKIKTRVDAETFEEEEE
ncbi:peptide deformylase [Savagea sp. SN6]|uniref:Peptide deformylase n=1 Tax=Savagea serpentis TaxID=2785297 RepID=A0A8J7G687_9BACL|nr:peptide deformylase [Savagea serpentis]MBF4499893.1 peptide deformylase [Savagea serpentis]